MLQLHGPENEKTAASAGSTQSSRLHSNNIDAEKALDKHLQFEEQHVTKIEQFVELM
jgi:hypothetical protein